MEKIELNAFSICRLRSNDDKSRRLCTIRLHCLRLYSERPCLLRNSSCTELELTTARNEYHSVKLNIKSYHMAVQSSSAAQCSELELNRHQTRFNLSLPKMTKINKAEFLKKNFSQINLKMMI